jgi:CheY-like chemotaxis protein
VLSLLKRILLVDDEPDIRELVSFGLERHYEVRCAENGQEALDVLLSEHIDAVVLDLAMPVMTGRELLAELDRRHLGVPVVIASAEQNLRALCSEMHVAHCVSKPYGLSALMRVLDNAMTS